MGRTIPSFRIASVMEEKEWKPFRNSLDKSDRKKFDQMFSIAHMYNSASSYAAKPVRWFYAAYNQFLCLLYLIIINSSKGCVRKLKSVNLSLIEFLLEVSVSDMTGSETRYGRCCQYSQRLTLWS